MYKKKKIGQSLVEFAVLTPFIILVLATILELSPLLNAYVKIEKATQAAAREASIFGATDNQVLEKLLGNMYGMAYMNTFTDDPARPGEKFIAYKIADNSLCPLIPNTTLDPHKKYIPTEDYPSEHCYSRAIEGFGADPQRTVVDIVPTLKSRVNGSWVSVSVRYNYRVYTPVLYFFADILWSDKTSQIKRVPMYKFSTQRIE